jgi:penicillin V acylase-like amidase (Ntn superfamily)
VCTRAMWTTPSGAVLVGRTMDWQHDMRTNIWALPAGIKRDGLVAGGLAWTAQFGSVVATAYDIAASDGLNDAGLGAHLLWLAESDYVDRDPTRPALAPSIWMQYFLDNFATVADAVAFLEQTPVQIVAQVDPVSGEDITVHLVLDDASGDSAVVEYVDGRTHIHHDPSFNVVTNSPPFDHQLENLRRFKGFGGAAPLPGTNEAADRFVRAAYYIRGLPAPRSDREAVAEILSVMRNTSQPFGTPDPDRPNIAPTIWRTVSDLTSGLYFYESAFDPNIVWIRIADLDLSLGQPALKLDLHGESDLVGDVTSRFQPSEPFEFAAPGEATGAAAPHEVVGDQASGAVGAPLATVIR